jgi:hypothetical protein
MMPDLDLLIRFPPASRARLRELTAAAEADGVTFTAAESNRIVVLRMRAAATAAGAPGAAKPLGGNTDGDQD